MQILQFSKYYPPVFGGIERVVYDITTSLQDDGYRCDVLCSNVSILKEIDIKNENKIIRCGEFGTLFSMSISPGIIISFIIIENDYDVIHVHMPNPLANIAMFFKRKRSKIVIHWHSDIVKQKMLLYLYAPLQNWLLKRADAIIATSLDYAEGSRWLHPYLEKTHVVPIGIDTDHLDVDESKVNAIRQRFGGRSIVFSLGRLTYYKGFEYLIRAAIQIEDACVVIGGEGERRSVLEALIQKCGVKDRVVLLGDIPSSDLGSYFSACDVFCLPSHVRSEAFGVVQLEAMALGKPVVSTRIPGSGVGWVNEHDKSGLVVEPASPVALAHAINTILGSAEMAARLGKGARERYNAMFRKESMANRILKVYQDVLAQKNEG